MTFRMGIIGVGGLGHLQTKTYTQIDGVSIVGAADVSEDARNLFEEEFGAPAYKQYQDLLDAHENELDGVTIVTPHTLHYEQAKACMERGINVLVEKPMVTDIDHAVDLVETAKERGVTLQVGYQRHFHPAFKEIRRIIQSGRIGTLHAVNCYLGQDWIDIQQNTWRTNPQLSGGGQLYDSGGHLLDALLWTTGAVPASVAAQIEYEKPQIDVNSALSLQLDTDDSTIIGSVGVSGDGVDMTPSEGYFYWGTEGRLTYIDGEIAVSEQGAMTYRTEITSGTDFQTLNREKLDNFIESIQGTEEPAVPGEVGLQVTALTEAVYQAAETSSSVAVQPIIDEAYATRP